MIRTPNAWIFASLVSLLSVLKGYSAIFNLLPKRNVTATHFKSISGWWGSQNNCCKRRKFKTSETQSQSVPPCSLLVWKHLPPPSPSGGTRLTGHWELRHSLLVTYTSVWLYFCVAVPRLCACVRMSGVSKWVHAIVCYKCVGVVDLGFS